MEKKKINRRGGAAIVAIVAAVTFAAGLAVPPLIARSGNEDQSAADRAKNVLRPIIQSPNSDDIVATVNGAPISRYRLEGTLALSPSGTSVESVLDALIEYELLYQEGVQRGLVATDEAVEAAIAESRSAVSPDAVQASIDLAREQGIEITQNSYWSHPVTVEAIRRSVTVAAAREALLEDVHPAEREAQLARLIASLREAATIEVVDP
ncbi:MAG TPA: hypothetical protein PJ994_06040 [Tepidiformaceae bacterium]|nr:hypothetical protein [Tepidiformaceae bacterium]